MRGGETIINQIRNIKKLILQSKTCKIKDLTRDFDEFQMAS